MLNPPPLHSLQSPERGISPSRSTILLNNLSTIRVPTDHEEATLHQGQKQAMDSEIQALLYNQTLLLADLPAGKKAVGYKWVYTSKFKSDGTLDRYKARLVAKGYYQTPGLDFTDISHLQLNSTQKRF